jgi:hypothetical protein
MSRAKPSVSFAVNRERSAMMKESWSVATEDHSSV